MASSCRTMEALIYGTMPARHSLKHIASKSAAASGHLYTCDSVVGSIEAMQF